MWDIANIEHVNPLKKLSFYLRYMQKLDINFQNDINVLKSTSCNYCSTFSL